MNPSDIFRMMNEQFRGVEKLVWAFTGAKRCSFSPPDANAFPSELSELGLEVRAHHPPLRAEHIAQKGWPDEDDFNERFLTESDTNGDLAMGLFLDIPYCCAKSFHDDTRASVQSFYDAHPFREQRSRERDAAYNRAVNRHMKEHDFTWLKSADLNWDALNRARKGMIPKSTFLLLDNYIPCEPACDAYIEQSQLMEDSLREYLPNEWENIRTRYEDYAFGWHKA